jgi:DNA topoisomerase IB
VCRKCYIHPAVLSAFTSGVTLSTVTLNKARAAKGLLEPEARLVALLRRPDRVRKAA